MKYENMTGHLDPLILTLGGNKADADFLCFLHGETHAEVTDNWTEDVVSIDVSRGSRFTDDLGLDVAYGDTGLDVVDIHV